METIEAEDRDAHPDLLRRVRGKTVAVDLLIWIFEDTSQPELAEIFTPAGQVARLVFDRACNLLRHGVCLLYTSPSPRDATLSRMPSSA